MRFFLIFFVYILFSDPVSTSSDPRKILIISLDGFRSDYLDSLRQVGRNISFFERLKYFGFQVERIENEFITKTAPNHWSIVTGMHQESHGVVSNTFYDPLYNESFSFGNQSQSTDPKWFLEFSEPIWITNQRHGFLSGVIFWPGSSSNDTRYSSIRRFIDYNESVTLKERIDTSIRWFDETNMNLCLLYYHEPDKVGHSHGPDSSQLQETIETINKDLEYLSMLLDRRPMLKANLNIFVTSDHGMIGTSRDRMIYLDRYIDTKNLWSLDKAPSPVIGLWPKSDISVDNLVHSLSNRHKMMHVYRKEDLPTRLYYSKNRRIAPVVVYAEPGWLISMSSSSKPTRLGEHGYDPIHKEMSPFMIAAGPSLVQLPANQLAPPVKMIDLYPLFCHILGLFNMAPHNGSLDRVVSLLRKPVASQPIPSRLVLILFATALAVVALLITICWYIVKSRRRSRQGLESTSQLRARRLVKGFDPRHANKTMESDRQRLLPLNQVDAHSANELSFDDHAFIQMLHQPRTS